MIQLTVEKPKRKVRKLSELRKPIVIGSIISVAAVAGIIGGLLIFMETDDRRPEPIYIFNYAIARHPIKIDPLLVDSNVDTYIVETVAEGLFGFSNTNDSAETVSGLAIDYEWSVDSLNFTCWLRQGVEFHDGTSFNASAVKWNFDRIHRLLNVSALPHLWLLPNERQIINETQIIDEYTVRFVLNAPYAPLRELLTCYASYIVSPSSTPANEFIDIFTEDIIGTGPFIWDYFELDVNLSLIANQDYWGGEPHIDRLNILKKEGFTGVMDSLVSGESHAARFLSKLYEYELDIVRNTSILTYKETLSANLRWMLINNKRINVTMRKAIAFACNYSVIEAMGGVRNPSSIPHIVRFHNTTGILAPYYNLSIARQTLIDANWNGTSGLTANDDTSPGNEWETIANSSYPLATYNYTTIAGDPPESLFNILLDMLIPNLKQIGVKVNPVNVSFTQYYGMRWNLFGYNRDMFELSHSFWGADFNDPSNFVNDFFTNNEFAENYGQVNDSLTQILMDQALEETNSTLREQLYYQIQKRLAEEVYPIICSQTTYLTDIFNVDIKGWFSNSFLLPFKDIYFY